MTFEAASSTATATRATPTMMSAYYTPDLAMNTTNGYMAGPSNQLVDQPDSQQQYMATHPNTDYGQHQHFLGHYANRINNNGLHDPAQGTSNHHNHHQHNHHHHHSQPPSSYQIPTNDHSNGQASRGSHQHHQHHQLQHQDSNDISPMLEQPTASYHPALGKQQFSTYSAITSDNYFYQESYQLQLQEYDLKRNQCVDCGTGNRCTPNKEAVSGTNHFPYSMDNRHGYYTEERDQHQLNNRPHAGFPQFYGKERPTAVICWSGQQVDSQVQPNKSSVFKQVGDDIGGEHFKKGAILVAPARVHHFPTPASSTTELVISAIPKAKDEYQKVAAGDTATSTTSSTTSNIELESKGHKSKPVGDAAAATDKDNERKSMPEIQPTTRTGLDLIRHRKNASRDATATLQEWLKERSEHPYPTKSEKNRLAARSNLTLTQVSTWFANARRRMKRENKLFWGPTKTSGNCTSLIVTNGAERHVRIGNKPANKMAASSKATSSGSTCGASASIRNLIEKHPNFRAQDAISILVPAMSQSSNMHWSGWDQQSAAIQYRPESSGTANGAANERGGGTETSNDHKPSSSNEVEAGVEVCASTKEYSKH